MYTPRTSVEAIPNASIHHSALQNRDFGHTYDRSRALVRALVEGKPAVGRPGASNERLHPRARIALHIETGSQEKTRKKKNVLQNTIVQAWGHFVDG